MVPDIILKTRDEIHKIHHSARILARGMALVENIYKDTGSLAAASQGFYQSIVQDRAEPVLLKMGFPDGLSINTGRTIAHGLWNPSGSEKGRYVRFDSVIKADHWHADMGMSLTTEGDHDPLILALEDLFCAIGAFLKPASYLGDLGEFIEKEALKRGLYLWKEGYGHGIGASMHEDPMVPSWDGPSTGSPIVPGMVFTIELFASFTPFTVILQENQVISSQDKVVFKEHMYAIHSHGNTCLTKDFSAKRKFKKTC